MRAVTQGNKINLLGSTSSEILPSRLEEDPQGGVELLRDTLETLAETQTPAVRLILSCLIPAT